MINKYIKWSNYLKARIKVDNIINICYTAVYIKQLTSGYTANQECYRIYI